MHLHIINTTLFGGAETIAAKLAKKFGKSIIISLYEKNNKYFEKRFNVKVKGLYYLLFSIIKYKNIKIISHNLQSHIVINLLGISAKFIFWNNISIYNVIHFDAKFVNKKWLLIYIITIKLIRPKLVFVSDFAKFRFEEISNLKRIKSKIIYNSIDKKFFKKTYNKILKEINSKKIHIGFIGRYKPIKRLPLFIEICNELSQINKNVYKFVIQSDISKKELIDLLKTLSDQNKISLKYKDFQLISSEDNPTKFYKICDIVISTSKTESFGLVFVETVAMGKRFYCINSTSFKMLIGESIINIETEIPEEISKFLNNEISRNYILPDISMFKEEIMINEYSKI